LLCAEWKSPKAAGRKEGRIKSAYETPECQSQKKSETPKNQTYSKRIIYGIVLKTFSFHVYLSSGYCWIGLLDCSIRIAIEFGGLDCD